MRRFAHRRQKAVPPAHSIAEFDLTEFSELIGSGIRKRWRSD